MRDQEDVESHLFLFACIAFKGGKHGLARKAWEKYLAVRPSDTRALFNLGTCLEAQREYSAALACFRQAFCLKPDMSEAAANAAGLLIREGNAEEACVLCFRARAHDAGCSPLLYNLNTALRMCARDREAIALTWQWVLEKLPVGHDSAIRKTCAAFAAAISAASVEADERSKGTLNDGLIEERCVGSASPTEASATVLKDPARRPSGRTGKGAREKRSAGPAVRGDDADPEAQPSVATLTVVCVRWGTKYGLEYVERLASGVQRHLHKQHAFVCYTDDVAALSGLAGVEARPLGRSCQGWNGWWNKAYLFAREACLTGRVLYIDLDTVISGSLEDIAGHSGPFAALSAADLANERRASGLNSSIMAWGAADFAHLHAVHEVLEKAYAAVTACVHKFDHWLEMTVPSPDTLQALFPGQIVEYTADCCISPRLNSGAIISERGQCRQGSAGGNQAAFSSQVPENARIICFPLQPKPHEVSSEWMQRMWVGDEEACTPEACPSPDIM